MQRRRKMTCYQKEKKSNQENQTPRQIETDKDFKAEL